MIASPFICVPPQKYGGTELFLGQLAEELTRIGHDVVVYTVGESTVNAEIRWMYPRQEWPVPSEVYGSMKDLNHTSWALADCWNEADIVHLNNAPGLAFSRFDGPRFAYTVHHESTPRLSEFYSYFPSVEYITISQFQRDRERFQRGRTIHHGVDLSLLKFHPKKQEYLSFLGRIAPVKGTHIAIEVAKRSGIPLKIAGEIQPIFKDYYDTMVKPHVDGRFIEYVGEADLAIKNELLGNSRAMLFPIQWNEPFGLVMIEAMATGTPVIAMPMGSVPEVVKDGISGYVCKTAAEMAERAKNLRIAPQGIRTYAQQYFSVERMAREYAALYKNMLSGDERVLKTDIDELATENPDTDAGNTRVVA